MIAPVSVGVAGASGIALSGRSPGGARRAGLLAHRYEAKLIGLETRQYTGWLADSIYAPHTENGFRAPANKTVLLLANGFMARRGLKQARALGRASWLSARGSAPRAAVRPRPGRRSRERSCGG